VIVVSDRRSDGQCAIPQAIPAGSPPPHRQEVLAAPPSSASPAVRFDFIRRIPGTAGWRFAWNRRSALPTRPPAAPEAGVERANSAAIVAYLASVCGRGGGHLSAARPALQGLALMAAIRGVTGRDGHPCNLVSLLENTVVPGCWTKSPSNAKRDERKVPCLNCLEGRDFGQHPSSPLMRCIAAAPDRMLDRQTKAGSFWMIVKKTRYEYLELLFRLPPYPADHEVRGQLSAEGAKRVTGVWKHAR